MKRLILILLFSAIFLFFPFAGLHRTWLWDSTIQFCEEIEADYEAGDKDDVRHLLHLLTHEKPDVRFIVARSLGNIADVSTIPFIIDALKEEHFVINTFCHQSMMQDALVAALAKIGKPALPALIAALKSENSNIRDFALEVLLDIGDTSAIPALVGLLGCEDEWCRSRIIRCLALIGDKSVVPALCEVLLSDDSEYRLDAVDALVTIGDKSAIPALEKALKFEEESESDIRTIKEAIEKLKNMPDDTRSKELAELFCVLDYNPAELSPLSKLTDKQIVEFLNKTESWEFFEENAIQRLYEPENDELVQKYINGLHSEYEDFRCSACTELGELRNLKAVKPLINSLLNDGYHGVREIAAVSLGQLKAKSAVEPLINALKNDTNKHVKEACVLALCDIRDESTAELIINVMRNNPEEKIREACIYALCEIGDKSAVQTLIEILNDEDDYCIRLNIIQAFGRFGDNSAQSCLVEILKNKKECYLDAGIALMKLGNTFAIEELKKIYNSIVERWDNTYEGFDKIFDKIQIAGELISLDKKNEAVYLQLLIKKLRGIYWNYRIHAASVLGKINNDMVRRELKKALFDESYGVRQAAANSLGEIGDESVIPILERNTKSWDESLRIIARAAIINIKYRQHQEK